MSEFDAGCGSVRIGFGRVFGKREEQGIRRPQAGVESMHGRLVYRLVQNYPEPHLHRAAQLLHPIME